MRSKPSQKLKTKHTNHREKWDLREQFQIVPTLTHTTNFQIQHQQELKKKIDTNYVEHK